MYAIFFHLNWHDLLIFCWGKSTSYMKQRFHKSTVLYHPLFYLEEFFYFDTNYPQFYFIDPKEIRLLLALNSFP